MNFAPTANQESISDSVDKICAPFDDAYWLKKDKEGGFPADFHKAMADAGWLGICIPEEYGGSGLGITDAAIMMRAIAESGAGMSGASAVHMNVFGLNPVVVFGTPEQCRRMLPPIISGADKSCFAVTEPNTGLNTTQLKTRAGRQQDLAAGAHDDAGRGKDADAGAEPVLYRFRPPACRGARDREDGPQ